MNPEIKVKWIEALRSGKYKQTNKVLKRQLPDGSFGYCCLGVLCEVMGKEFASPNGFDYACRLKEHKKHYGTLPTSINSDAALGLDNEGRLSIMNDEGKSFEEIARFIEEKL